MHARPARGAALALFILFTAAGCGSGGGSSPRAATAAAATSASTGAVGVPWPTGPVTAGYRLGISYRPPLGADPASSLRRARDLDAIAAAGLHVLRTDFRWGQIEPTRGVFDFTPYDRLVDEAARRGIEVLPLLCYGTSWASRLATASDPNFPPDDPADFARYAGATAAHFRGRVRRYEVWNEENVGVRFWKPTLGGDAAAYGALLIAAHTAIHAADPRAEVGFGGSFWQKIPLVSAGTLGFTRAVFAAHPGLASSFEAFAYHPYRYPLRSPEAPPISFLPSQEPLTGTVAACRTLLARHGSHAPLWITEVGWDTAQRNLPFPGVSEADQARFLARATVLALARGVDLFCWYTLRDGPNSTRDQEQAFGLLAYDRNPLDAVPARRKPAYLAEQTLATRLGATRFDRDVRALLGLPAAARAYRFVGPGAREVTVLWTTDATPVTAQVAVPAAASRAEGVTLDGRAATAILTRTAAGGRVAQVALGADPVLIDAR